MADAPVYAGHELSGGFLTVEAPSAPMPSWGPQPGVTTTADVQRSAEGAAGEVQDDAVLVPFGPAITKAEAETPGWMTVETEDGVKRAFRVAEGVGMMPMLRFAHAAKSGMDTDDMEGMAALYTMIRDTVDPLDWDAFQDYATMTKAEDDELLDFVSAAIEVISARKARQRGSSSGTSPNTSAKSKGSSSRQASVIPPGATQPEEAAGLVPVADLVARR